MKYLPIIFVALLAFACSRVPSGVIDQDDMAYVLADMYMAESYVEQNYNDYNTDSARRMLKQSVLAKYDYETADFDSSLMWYGMHSDIYMKVNDRVMEILKERDRDLGSAILQSNSSFSGDSVDVWSGARYALFNRRMPSYYVSFEIDADENQEAGDVYSWRVKSDDEKVRSFRWVMLAQYSDSTYDYLNTMTSMSGLNEALFATDSTKDIVALRGYFEPVIDGEGKFKGDKSYSGSIWVDSISLIRKRVNPEEYSLQRSRLSKLKPLPRIKHIVSATDTLTSVSD